MQSEVELCRKTLIRVKRKRGEQRVDASKKCKFVGSCDTNDDNNAYQLIDNGLLKGEQPQQLFKITDFDVEMICDENALNRLDLKEAQNTICCNDEPLEVVDNNSCDYIYDIYLYDNVDNDNLDNNYRECDDEEPSSNDENYEYNDYPDDSDVEKHNDDNDDDYYDAFDDEEDEALRKGFAKNTIKSNECSDSRSESDSDDYLAAKQYSDDSSSCDDY